MTGTVSTLHADRPLSGSGPSPGTAARPMGDGFRLLPTLPPVADLLPYGGLRAGASYAVQGSTTLAMAMLAGPAAEGSWCGVVAVPTLGAEAAAGLGVDLDRLVLVPEPGREWLNVVAALADALTVVVVRPPGRVTAAEASRLSARLRHRGAVLITLGPWPGAEARLTVEENDWSGLGRGHGCLTARQATVTVAGRGSAVRSRRHRLWLPDLDGSIRQAPGPASERLDSTPDWRREAVG